ncbi:ankyrin repeat domain-containing protein 26-like [Molossus nigricans]
MENEYSDRFILKEDKEKKQKSDLLFEEETEQLINEEQQDTKEVKINPQLKTTDRIQEMEMIIISDNYEKEYLLHENHMLQDENAKLRLEIDTVKNQTQEMEKKHFEDMKIILEKNDHLNMTIQLAWEILKNTAQNIMQNSDLENKKQNRQRLETEVESSKSRLATATQDHEHYQASQRDLQLTFQSERDQLFCLGDQKTFDTSNLTDNNEHCQELSKVESKFSSLEIQLNHTREALRERTLVLEGVQRDLSQTQCQKKQMEHIHQTEQDKLHEYIKKQGSLEEQLSHLQRKNMLLQQQLDAADNKADDQSKAVIEIRDLLQDITKILQTEYGKPGLTLNKRNIECSHLNERIDQYKNDKAEGDAGVAQLQQELADTLKKESMLEASLDITSHDCMNLEDETQDLKRKLDENRSQTETAQACLDPLRTNRNTSATLLKRRVKELEFELFGMKMSRDYALEQCQQHYKKLVECTKSLKIELKEIRQQQRDIQEKLLLTKEENRFSRRKLKLEASPRHAWC